MLGGPHTASNTTERFEKRISQVWRNSQSKERRRENQKSLNNLENKLIKANTPQDDQVLRPVRTVL